MLTQEQIKELSLDELLEAAIDAYALAPADKLMTLMRLKLRARELDILPDFEEFVKTLNDIDGGGSSNKSGKRRESAASGDRPNECQRQSIEQFHAAMNADQYYSTLRRNLLTNQIEITRDDKVLAWSEAENSRSKEHMSIAYGLTRADYHQDALNIVSSERRYNPLADMLNGLKWDGKPRMERALIDIMKCDDSDYSREVSRLIFSGGVLRAMNPGCKFDEVPILIGEKQGEGKSTFIRWLALKDEYFSDSVSDFDGQKSIEAIQGKWIVEISEMLAMKRAKDVEAIKSYLSRQEDYYRAPYERFPAAYPRFCIFIGSSNDMEILGDRTGNRRFYPLLVHSNGFDLYRHAAETKEYIRQCWAEAVALWRQGKLLGHIRPELRQMVQREQQQAEEEDPRLGLIEKYLADKPIGYEVCTFELWFCALGNDSDLRKPDPKKDLAPLRLLMKKNPEWQRKPMRVYTHKYGQQRVWQKVHTAVQESFCEAENRRPYGS